jgi:hypothetical protein
LEWTLLNGIKQKQYFSGTDKQQTGLPSVSVAPEKLMVIWNKAVMACSHIRPLGLRTKKQPLSD